ncbi:hypothetical protein ARMGADRAFT_1064513, partial [Armillaria gallica]
MDVKVVNGGGRNAAVVGHSQPFRRHLNDTHQPVKPVQIDLTAHYGLADNTLISVRTSSNSSAKLRLNFSVIDKMYGVAKESRSLRETRASESKSLRSTWLKTAYRSSFGRMEPVVVVGVEQEGLLFFMGVHASMRFGGKVCTSLGSSPEPHCNDIHIVSGSTWYSRRARMLHEEGTQCRVWFHGSYQRGTLVQLVTGVVPGSIPGSICWDVVMMKGSLKGRGYEEASGKDLWVKYTVMLCQTSGC